MPGEPRAPAGAEAAEVQGNRSPGQAEDFAYVEAKSDGEPFPELSAAEAFGDPEKPQTLAPCGWPKGLHKLLRCWSSSLQPTLKSHGQE